ncbi:MAG TPA: TonB-dependent receptor [Vicinamibacterales bacterium]|nr:TonB-dependent receptor [Vicinamibacterales bacterium]
MGRIPALLLFLLGCPAAVHAQTVATLQGRVLDSSGAALQSASITVRNQEAGFRTVVATNADGRYNVPAIPAGSYEVTAAAEGFRPEIIEKLTFEVGRTLVRDFRLNLGGQSEAVIVTAELPLLDRATSTVGHVVSPQTIRGSPLNGRHFVDLGLLVPGSVAPSQTGFSTTPIRGTGALAFNTAGNREEAVAYVINGVTTNNMTFGSIGFPSPVGSIEEFKVDNSTFRAEYGHVSGAIVNLITRSGTDRFRGEAYEFFRNDALDARNFFEFTSPDPHPFNRNQFGATLGGPVIRGRTFFFATYEGLRQRQGLDLQAVVPSDAQRAAVNDATIARLLPLIPRANYFDADGVPRFVGAGNAVVHENTWTADVRHNAGTSDRIQAFMGRQQVSNREPSPSGTNIPGFGQVRGVWKSTLTVNETHTFGASLLNEARFGQTAQDGHTLPAAVLNPVDFGIVNGVDYPVGLPQIIVAGALNFGGPAAAPQGRKDSLYVFNDTMTRVVDRHSMRFGGEYRRFLNNNFAEGTGQFNFPSMAAFLTGTANAFNITLGRRTSHITQDALSFFAQDGVRIGSNLTLDLGLRYEWHVTPTERDNQFVVFDAPTVSLARIGVNLKSIYQQNNRNFEPRLGLAWTPWGDGLTVIRAAYGSAVDQPGTTAVRDTTGNPPFATPLTATGSISPRAAVTATQPVRLAPVTIDPRFQNASMRSWNVNVQRQIARDLSAMIGYFGSRGANLRISRNINQPVNGILPFPSVSMGSPIRPGEPLGTITQVESTGFSSYNGLWVSANKRLSRGLVFDTSYTLSKSLDTNSLNSSGFAVQNGYDIAGEYGLSDFDARHRFVINAIYDLPFTGHALTRGWQLATIVQAQSGNPVNIVTNNSTLNGVANTVRPDLVAPVRITGSVDGWFDASSFAAANGFGNLRRNAAIGPGFVNTDLSVMKRVAAGRDRVLQLRIDAFDLFNHANFGPPGNVVGSPMFGKISRTRLPTGEAGSSRQIQLAAKLSF